MLLKQLYSEGLFKPVSFMGWGHDEGNTMKTQQKTKKTCPGQVCAGGNGTRDMPKNQSSVFNM